LWKIVGCATLIVRLDEPSNMPAISEMSNSETLRSGAASSEIEFIRATMNKRS